jgi:hypothetical protein
MKYLIPTYRKEKIKTAELFNGLDYLLFCDKQDFEKLSDKYNCYLLPDGIQGNIARVRNYILKYANENKIDYFAMCDDDISKLFIYDSELKSRLKELTAFEYDYILDKFSDTFYQKDNCVGWSMNETTQPRDYKGEICCNNACFMSGTFSVYFTDRITFEFDERLSLKEDYDFTLQALTSGKTIFKFKGLFYLPERVTTGLKNFGGCSTYRTNEKEMEQIQLMKDKWGNLIKYKDGDINGVINYRLLYNQ